MLDLNSDFRASPCEAVCEGFCVLLEGIGEGQSNERFGAIAYAGPIGGVGDVAGRQLLLHPADFAMLQKYLAEKRGARLN